MSACTGVVLCFGDVVIRETRVGPMPTDPRQIAVTTDGRHAAVVGMGGSRPAVFVDGAAGAPYTAISPWASLEPGKPAPGFLGWSPDNAILAYTASKGGQFTVVTNQHEGPLFDGIIGLAFSRVGHRLAYVGRRGSEATAFFVVIDGTPSRAYRSVRQVQFSADGRHFGYLAQNDNGAAPHHAVIDGRDGPGFGGISDLHLSPSGGHYAYVAQTLRTDGIDKAVVIDGAAGPTYGDIRGIVFSKDGRHVAYYATPHQTAAAGVPVVMAVIDGKPGPKFQQLPNSTVVFSPDGQRSAYAGQSLIGSRVRTFAVIDGNKSLDYDDCTDFTFSADSRRVAYLATNNGKSVVVLDGKESNALQAIDRQSLRFSADGTHFGYVAQEGNAWQVVIDHKPGAARQELIDGKSLEFSPDGQHHRFKIRTSSGDWNYVVDDHVDNPAAAPSKMAVSKDWAHRATLTRAFAGDPYHEALARHAGQPTGLTVALDDKPVGSGYEYVDLFEISPDGHRVAYSISKHEESGKNSDHVVIDGRESPGYFRVTRLLFSPDSQHTAYVAWPDGTKQCVVIDGFTGPVFDVVLGSQGDQPGALQFRPDGSLDYYAAKDSKLTHVMFDAATIASLPKPAAAGMPAGGYADVYAFGAVPKDGVKPAVLTAGPDGMLYGATSSGGQYHYGVIFKMHADGSGYTILHQIAGGQYDGAYPSSIFVGRDGAIYGTFHVQGPSGNGSIFRCAADGSDFKILHATQPNLDTPEPKLVSMAADGSFFGVSGRTSSSMPTHLFRMTPAGEFTLVLDTPYKQGDYNGLGPISDGRDGYFYGVFAGRLFKLKQDGTRYSVLHKFTGPPLDTWTSDTAPIPGSDGRLYGIASAGGQSGGGVVYSLGRDGSDYRLIVDPEADRLSPRALVEGSDRKLYALVGQGVARFNKDGSGYSIVHAADGGSFVETALVNADALYAMQSSGGKGNGLVFRYGFTEPTASSTPAIVVKEVPAEPLPEAEMGPAESVPDSAAGTAGVSDTGAGMTSIAAGTPAGPAMPATTPSPATPLANATPAGAGAPGSAAELTTLTQGVSTDAGTATTTLSSDAAVKKAESEADAAVGKAKAKAEQATQKAKHWFESLTKRKSN